MKRVFWVLVLAVVFATVTSTAYAVPTKVVPPCNLTTVQGVSLNSAGGTITGTQWVLTGSDGTVLSAYTDSYGIARFKINPKISYTVLAVTPSGLTAVGQTTWELDPLRGGWYVYKAYFRF